MGCSSGKEAGQQGNQHGLMKKSNKKKCVKIVLLGNVAVGKTSVTQRYVHGKFDPKYYNTLGGAYVEKIIQSQEGEQIQLNIWDTAGDERYRSIMPFYYRDAAAAILVYDVADSNSFQDLNYWIDELENKVKTEGMVLYLLGNKNDIDAEDKRVSKDMAESFAEQKNLLFGECSAKTGEGIEENFQILIQKLEEQNKITKQA